MAATAALDWAARLTGGKAADLAGAAEALTPDRIAAAPLFLPCLNGIRTAANRPGATGQIAGLHPGVDAALLGYATLEGVALQMADCIAAQAAVGVRAESLRAVGGGTRSLLWMRLLATALDTPVGLPEGADLAGPSGAARLAACAAGAGETALYAAPPLRATIDPDPVLGPLLEARRPGWSALLSRA
jgi:xylulokinase